MLNSINIMGRMVADATMRTTQTGKMVAAFRIACDRGCKDAGADFFDCVAWSKSAEFVSKYFPKGSMIAITGRLQSRQYDDKNGNKRTAIEIVADSVSFCGSKNDAPAREAKPDIQPDLPAGDDFREIDDSEDLPF